MAADSREEMRSQLEALGPEPSWETLKVAAAESRAEFATSRRFRLLMVLDEIQDFHAVLNNSLALLTRNRERSHWASPEGISFGSEARPGKLAFLFPGQGSQYVGMMRDLVCRFPAMLEALREANFTGGNGRRLSDLIYPPATFNESDIQRDEEALRATDVAQPALGAVSLGALRVLKHFGVSPDATAGHSYGELVALCAAERIDEAVLHALSRARGRLMADVAGDAGAMLAISAGREQVERVLLEESIEVSVANRNAPQQLVLSGPTAVIARASEAFSRRNIAVRQLAVAAAFHSPLVNVVREPFLEALRVVEFRRGRIPVFANTTGRLYPEQPLEVRELLAGQLARPVEFVEEIQSMYQSGIRTFLEVGPGQKLTGLVRSILAGKEHVALSLDASTGRRPGAFDLACALAHLAALGYNIDLHRWLGGTMPTRNRATNRATLTIPICGANYVKRRPSDTERHSAAVAPEKSAEPSHRDSKDSIMDVSSNGHSTSAGNRQTNHSTPTAAPVPAHSGESYSFAQALKVTQDNLLALQRLGEQTSHLHRQFLDGQDKILQAFQTLLHQQQQMIHGELGLAPVTATVPVASTASVISQAVTPAPASATPAVAPPPLAPVIAPASAVTVAKSSEGAEAGRAKAILLDVVAEKTGYPVEMLEIDMALDADLGIDSIKRVEILSAVQERLPEAPAVKPEHLGVLRTLREVVAFLCQSGQPETPSPPEHQNGDVVAKPARHESTRANAANVVSLLLGVVAEKTGYPVEMLELDMELDSDLGIDSIKRVEIFSTLQEQLPAAPAIKPEHIGSLRTLRQVADFIAEVPSERPEGMSAPAAAEPPATESVTDKSQANSPSDPPLALPVVAYELERTHLDGNRAKVTLPVGSEIWITEDAVGLSERVAMRLSALGYNPRRIRPFSGPYHPPTGTPAGLVILTSADDAGDATIKDAFLLLQHAAPSLRSAAREGGAVFLAVSRMDGVFGLKGFEGDPTAGGLAGLAKTAAREWPEVHCKAIDVAPSLDDLEEVALAVVDEMFHVGPIEVGITSHGRCTLGLRELVSRSQGSLSLRPGDVVVITGGARGITAEVAVALARSFSPRVVLVGRSAEPQAEPCWLSGLTDEGEIKRALLSNFDGQPSPREISEQYRQVIAAREIRRTIERLRLLGARAVYRSLDVRDEQAVRTALADVRSEFGVIRGLVHGAGVVADRMIEDKTWEQFERVYATKVVGLRNVLSGLDLDELRLLVLFSSSTARFGRVGQVDYAVANEILNKIAQQHARRYPDCRVLSANWGPWDGGMVTPSLKRVFEKEGIGTIPLDAGAEFLVRQIRCPANQSPEVVVLSKTERRLPALNDGAPLIVAFDRGVSLETCPVLESHVIDGRAVLPLVLSIEWLAHGAMHRHPDLVFQGFNDLRVLKGMRLSVGQSKTVRVLAGKARRDGEHYVVPAELHVVKHSGHTFTSVRAEVILADALGDAPAAREGKSLTPYQRSELGLYNELLFHGGDLQGIKSVEGCSATAISGMVGVAPPPATWLRQPLRNAWLTDPLALDSAFQLMVLWCAEQHGAASLPCYAGRYRQYRRSYPRDGVRVVAQVTEVRNKTARADIDFIDAAHLLVARLENYECVIDASLNQAFRRNRLAPSTVSV